jgi:hypothetical protein
MIIIKVEKKKKNFFSFFSFKQRFIEIPDRFILIGKKKDCN